MLKTYLNTVPHTKFVLIKDSVDQKDHNIFNHLVAQHLNRKQHKIHYFVFEGVYDRTRRTYLNRSDIILYDFVSDTKNWLNDTEKNQSFENTVLKLGENDIIVVDSLAQVIFHCGLALTYRIFNSLRNNKAIPQIITVLHKDLLEGDCAKVCLYFDNLSTLSIDIQPKFMSDNGRLRYVYKKSGGKVIEQTEEYRFEGENLVTHKIGKPDPSKLLEKAIPKEVNPENLSTFRIGLTDEEKLSRDKVVLPYLPKANEEKPQGEGKIFYQLDDVDDWDEEDPDDDLDI